MDFFNTSLFLWLFNIGSESWVSWFFIFLAEYIIYILTVIFIVLIVKEKSIRKRLYVSVVFILAEIIGRGIIMETIRFFYYHPRPFEALSIIPLISHDISASFPSGHTVYLFILSAVVFLLNKKWGWIFVGSSLLSGIARIAIGVHWPLDILGGIIIGFIAFGIAYLIFPSRFSEKKEESTQSAVIV